MLFFIVGIIMCLALGGFIWYKNSNTPDNTNTKQTSEPLAVKQSIKSSNNNTNYTTIAKDTANAKKLDELNTNLQIKLNELNTILKIHNINFGPSDFPDKLERKQHIVDNFEIIKQLISLICDIQSANVTKNYLINKMQMSEVRINQEIKIRSIINKINTDTDNIIETHLIDELLRLLSNDDKNTIINNKITTNKLIQIIKNDNVNIHKNPTLLKKILLMDKTTLQKLQNVQEMVKNIKKPKEQTPIEFNSDFIYDLNNEEMDTILKNTNEIQHIHDSIVFKQSVVGIFSRINFKEIMMQKNVDGINQEIKIRSIINKINTDTDNIIETHLIDELLRLLSNDDKNTIINNKITTNKLIQIIKNDNVNIHKNPTLLKKILLMDKTTLQKLQNVQEMVKNIKKPKEQTPIEFNSDFIYDLNNEEMDTILKNTKNIDNIREIIKGKSNIFFVNFKEILMRDGEKKRRTNIGIEWHNSRPIDNTKHNKASRRPIKNQIPKRTTQTTKQIPKKADANKDTPKEKTLLTSSAPPPQQTEQEDEKKLVQIKAKLREWNVPNVPNVLNRINLTSKEIDKIYTNIHGKKYKNQIKMLLNENNFKEKNLKKILLTRQK